MKKALLTLASSVIIQVVLGQEIKICHNDAPYFENTTYFELKSDLENGVYKVYRDQAKTTLEYVGEIINQKRVNTWIWYFESGSKKREIQYSNNVYNGLTTSYYPNGSKSVSMTYNQGVLNGPITRWFQDGKVKLTGSYVNGNQSGSWKYFKEDGSLLKEEQH